MAGKEKTLRYCKLILLVAIAAIALGFEGSCGGEEDCGHSIWGDGVVLEKWPDSTTQHPLQEPDANQPQPLVFHMRLKIGEKQGNLDILDKGTYDQFVEGEKVQVQYQNCSGSWVTVQWIRKKP